MKAKPYRRKYDVLHITKNTTREELGNFIGDHDGIGVKIKGIGFCANTILTVKDGNATCEIHPGSVILKNSEGVMTLIDNVAFNTLFYEEDK